MYPKDYFIQPTTAKAGSCFVIMPFARQMQTVYKAIVEAMEGPEVAFTCYRADELFGGGQIIKDVLEGIAKAELVIADVTSRNANVFYELGIAHMTKDIENVLIITQSENDVPFDLRQFRYFAYRPDHAGLTKLKKDLIESVKSVNRGVFRFAVADGDTYHFTHRLLGDENYLYDFCVSAYSGHDAAKFRLDVRRHSTKRHDEPTQITSHGLATGESIKIPHLNWHIRLDRTRAGKTYFSVLRPSPRLRKRKRSPPV